MVGKTVSHYQILEYLGGGGMGVVYKAHDLKLDRPVALKFLPPDLTRDPEAKQRFIHEAKAASALQHNNICTIHDVDQTEDGPGYAGAPAGGQMFIVMDFYEGETLKKKIARGPLKIEEAIDITMQVARGLARAHEHGIVHRDIKPANVMITSDGVAKIVDFGLAKLSGRTLLTADGTRLGTAAYMSPEQARGETCDHRTDLWSLGVVMYEMLCGRRPFESDYEQALVYSILNQEPKPLSEVNPAMQRELETVVRRSMSKDPVDRYQTAGDVITDLERIRKGEGPTRHRTWRKHPLRTILIAAASVVTIVGIALLSIVVFPSRAIPFSERDWIIIADFDNSTGEQVFDKSLNTAFRVSIEQSSYINVVPRRRISDVLRRMKKPETSIVDESTAREIALREGLSLTAVPGISKVGTGYALTWRIEEAKSGTTLKSGVIQARGQEMILPALDEMTQTIRRTMGESFLSITSQGKPLREVTTSSFEALSQYSLGIESHWAAQFEQAKLYYGAALKTDSTFTAARASLGMLCYEKFDQNEGKLLLAEAVKHVDELTAKERYGILAFHARAVENNLDKAVDQYKALLALYPDYSAAHNNLAWFYFQKGQLKESVGEFKEALRVDPSLSLTYYGLVRIYLYHTGDVDSAIIWSRRQLAICGEQARTYDNLGYALFGKDSLEQAVACFQKVIALDPAYVVALFRLSDTYRMLGRFKDAIPPLEEAIRVDSSASWALYQLGLLHRSLGNSQAAQKYLEMFRREAERWVKKTPTDGKNYLALGMVLSRLGHEQQGQAMGRRGMALDSSAHFEIAHLLAVQGKYREAIDQLEMAIRNGFTNYVWIKLHPDLWQLRNEPRYQQLLHRVIKG